MGPSAGHGRACRHVGAAPEPTSDSLHCCFRPLPPPTATHILAALLWRGRRTGSGGASEEEGLGGLWPAGCLSWMVATTAGASAPLGAPLGESYQVNTGRQSGEAVWPQVGVAGTGVVGYLMPSSGLHWQEFTDLPGSLN